MPRRPSKPKTTRRGKNEGSVYRRKDGKWVGQVTVGYHPDTGKPIRKYTYVNTREEAARWIALTLVSETATAAPSLSSELLLRDFLHRWLTTFKTYEVCSRTMELYYSCERLHIAPALGDIPIAALTASRIQTFLYHLQAEKQLSRRTISLVRSILIQLYDYAVEMSLAPSNPARSTKLPRQPQHPETEEKVIPIAQREAVLAAAQNDPIMYPIITTLLFTGMRIGELLALQWKHIDFAARTITIAQSVTRELTFDENGKTVNMADALGSTKTRTSHRVIQAPTLVLTRLREWMRYVARLRGGLETLTPEGFVFISTRTMSMRTYSGFRASYRHFLERSGFSGEGLNLHRYRHTYASMLLEQEINSRIVQKLLGHRDVSTTLGIYTHVVPEVFASVVAAVDNASQQLMDGTYTPKRSAEAVRAQLQQIDPMLSEDMTVNLKYL